MTEFCGLRLQLKVLLCFAAGTPGLFIQAEASEASCSKRHRSAEVALNLELIL